jgi:hypothetical protein
MYRRAFVQSGAIALITPALPAQALPGKALAPGTILGKLVKEEGSAPIGGASWYVAQAEGDGFEIRFDPGTLSAIEFLTADFLLDGIHQAVFSLALQEGEKGRTYRFHFGGLNQASFRMRMPMELTNQNEWMIDREGAFLKPIAGGQRVDPKLVDRIRFTVLRKGPNPVRWCMTPIHLAPGQVEKLKEPLLPKGKLIDELGQSTVHDWPGKTRGVAELKQRIQAQYAAAAKQSWPAEFSRWGGWKSKKLGKGTGYFGVQKDERRWWLVDPDGYAFWSSGVDCVRVDTDGRYDGLESALTWLPDENGEFKDAFGSRAGRVTGRSINYLAANMIRTFGPQGWRDKWATVALAELKRLRFNTVGNWSEWEFARKAKMPYVRPMGFRARNAGFIYRDFPDVYHAQFESDAAAYAAELKDTATDPAFIGYFLMNEPKWGFSSELPAAGMLYTSESNATRNALVSHLKMKYADDTALASAWKLPVTFEKVGRGKWQVPLTPEALADLRAFSVLMVERYFTTLSKACKKVDPNHLNLGMRWASVPPDWATEGMKSFDVYSLNCYQNKLPVEASRKIESMLKMPVMVGEWHFGALDVGLPASGIGHLKNQEDRAKAYRIYLEDAAANPYCVGVHWFTLYDQSALGRFDGENYNIGFLDVCNRTYDEIGNGAIASHERMYTVAVGKAQPFTADIQYLPKLFL